MIDIELVVFLEEGANVFADLSDWVLGEILLVKFMDYLLGKTIQILLNFHELDTVLYKFVLEAFLFEL